MTLPEPREVHPARSATVPRHEFFGTYVDGYSVDTLLSRVASAVKARGLFVLQHHNAHSLALMRDDGPLRDSYAAADSVFVDGIGAALVGRALGADVKASERVAVLDWIWPLCARAEADGWHIVHVGGSTAMLEQAQARIRARHPALRFTTIDGYFDPDDPDENGEVLARLRADPPSVLLVGMGMPRQERWVQENTAALPPCVVITVGGILGFVSGNNPTPPRWIGRLGVEWLFRLVTEPRRLWHRYLVEPLPLVPVVLKARLSRR